MQIILQDTTVQQEADQQTPAQQPTAESNDFAGYSRPNPTPHYNRLIEFYQQMHSHGYNQMRGDTIRRKEGTESFPGKKTLEFRDAIKGICHHYQARTLFEYGAGKAGHYSETLVIQDNQSGESFAGLKAYWGVENVTTWEPGLDQPPPFGKHDGVLCVDVLEHCFIGDIFWIVNELFSLANKFVFANIACYPAQAMLPNGNNVHTLVRKPAWWQGVFDTIASQHPDVDYLLCCAVPSAQGPRSLKWFQREHIEPYVDEYTNFER